jgi:hypothetical protein
MNIKTIITSLKSNLRKYLVLGTSLNNFMVLLKENILFAILFILIVVDVMRFASLPNDDRLCLLISHLTLIWLYNRNKTLNQTIKDDLKTIFKLSKKVRNK